MSAAAPVPTLVRLDPGTVAVGATVASGQRMIQITGRNFTPQTLARVGGADRTTKYVSDTKLELILTDADLAQAGSLIVTTGNAPSAAGGGGTSNTLNLGVPGCSYTLSGPGRAYKVSPTGETLDSVLLETADHCPWTVTASASWIRLEGPRSGVGHAPIPFTVVNNPGGGGRTGTITINGQNFIISQPSGLAAVSAASYVDLSASGALATLFSSGLSATTQVATSLPLPTTLGGVRVTLQVGVTGGGLTEVECPLFFVSPTQINFQVSPQAPFDPNNNTFVVAAPLQVYRDGVVVATGTLKLANVAPSLFSANATGQGAAVGVALRVKANGEQSYEPLAEFDAASSKFVTRAIDLGPEGERVFLVLFGTGFRRRSSLENLLVTADGLQLLVSYAGAQGELVGVDQVNAELGRELKGRGEVRLQMLIDNRTSNRVIIRVK